MKTSKVLLMLAAILSFDLSLFLAAISMWPKWSAAFGAPSTLVADGDMLFTAGLSTALAVAICGIYGLSGAGVIMRLPMLRLVLLVSGCGCLFRGTFVIPELIAMSYLSSIDAPIPWRLVAASLIILLTGLAYLAGLALGWEALAAGRHETPGCADQRCSPTPAS